MAVEAKFEGWQPCFCAYLAGLIDGDGCITIRRRDRSKSVGDRQRGVSFILRVSIGGETEHLTSLRSQANNIGNLWVRTRPGQRHLAEWTIAGKQARSLLRLVYPYLQLKLEQAVTALGMPAPRSRWGVTPELRDTQERARVRVSELNRLGRGKVVMYGR